MQGYVVPDKPELKMREYELYRAYYCGICKSIGRRYGQFQRFALHYDFVFLAMILSSLSEESETANLENCIAHPFQKRVIVKNEESCDYAADMLLILAYHKLADDYADERKWVGLIGAKALGPVIKKLDQAYPETTTLIRDQLAILHRLEKEGCASMDQAAEPFGRIMEAVFSSHREAREPDCQLLLKGIGYHVGKWVYLIDALDDLEKDRKTGNYNPLARQFDLGTEELIQRISMNLTLTLAELSRLVSQLPIKKNKDLLENFTYLGLLKQTEQIIEKRSKVQHAESL